MIATNYVKLRANLTICHQVFFPLQGSSYA
jgi:hypothetical protein